MSPLVALLALAGCKGEAPEALIERGYQPETEYRSTVRMVSLRSLHQAGPDGTLLPDERVMHEELTTTQRLRVGPAQDGACLVELDMLDYRIIQPEAGLQMDLLGCVGVARYDLARRHLSWLGLKDTLWQAGAARADSNFTLQRLSAREAAAYLASTVELLNSALDDSTRRLIPGQGWTERSRQETTIGPWRAAWTETRTVTLRDMAGGMAFFDVQVALAPEALPGSPPFTLEGSGSGGIDFDLALRCTARNNLKTTMTIEIADSALTWIARSETSLDIRTSARAPGPAR